MKIRFILISLAWLVACNSTPSQEPVDQIPAEAPFMWENATMYFMLTDRFYNGDTTNDQSYGRQHDGALLRNFEGGDFKGITQKLRSSYFDDLGVNALWFSPPFEQVHGFTDEGTGKTYSFHGYWIKDWSAIDASYGSYAELRELVEEAHSRGIRVVLDVIINHTGPVTPIDNEWPAGWVRTAPQCKYKDFESTVTCTLVRNLPDIKTESDEEVDIPDFLKAKWEAEGRLEQEMAELDAFFDRTGYPRAPRFYIIKWLTDLVRELGIDGFRVDTVKHTEASVWKELYKEAVVAFNDWKTAHPDEVLDDTPFYMLGEVYNYVLDHGQEFSYGDTSVNFYANGFNSLINFSFKYDAKGDMEANFNRYSEAMQSGALKGYSVMNYISSHDDGTPYDSLRQLAMEGGTRLLLSPGAAQIYYGDETSRLLHVPGTVGDAKLRSLMNWEELESNLKREGVAIQDVLAHWQQLGKFRKAHPALGAGQHAKVADEPYTFSRTLTKGDYVDKVLVAVAPGDAAIAVADLFAEGTTLTDYYTGQTATVTEGTVKFSKSAPLFLIAP